ncbi:hypothetical protein BT_0709 [Bartonella tribocorum CIP 105476]|uniref:Uncharacterized protein n=1 Tax=Bartonella tribocorum (strain DSM 28219 / CCUG 45778 / CIP 105476 / IBS 506) TaxID=382640 RepID=A9IR42_BART1|nr:hypothetical protein BT_0709 [Bartonella tribocorum CIP 105476]
MAKCEMVRLFFHKHKDGAAQRAYPYTTHGHRHEIGLGALKEISLK